MIWNIKKQKTTNENNRKKEESKKKKKKKGGPSKEPLGQLQAFKYSYHKGARRRRERARNWKSI